VPFLRTLHYDDRVNHLGGRSDVEVQTWGGVRIGVWVSVTLSLSSASWASTVQVKRSCFFRSW
jgi:hypothetical protein